MTSPVDLDAVQARYALARAAGLDADDAGNGWDQPKINAVVRSWQDVAELHDEVRRLRGAQSWAVPQALVIRPGDTLVVRMDPPVNLAERDRMRNVLTRDLPGVRPVVVVAAELAVMPATERNAR